MKKFLFALCFCTSAVFCQNIEVLPRYTPEQLRNDIDTLVSNIEEIHINPYYKCSKKKFYTDIKHLKEEITQPINIIDFFYLASPIIAQLEDGHTSINPPVKDLLKFNKYLFPYKVELSDEVPYIVITSPFKSMPSLLPKYAKIISINGIMAKEIVGEFMQISSAESEKFKAKRHEEAFGLMFSTIFKTDSIFDVKYIPNDEVQEKSIRIPSISYDSLAKRISSNATKDNQNNTSDYSLKIDNELKTATIDFISFNDLGKFKKFIDSTFVILKKEKIKNLIIDITHNGGGNSRLGDELLQYISAVPFNQYPMTKFKFSRLQKADYKTNRVQFLQDSSFLTFANSEPNGTVKVYDQTDMFQPYKKRNRYKGKTYLLTSSYTFSSAASFAAAFKFCKMGTIIGEETGGRLISYGDIITVSLPNSKLSFIASHQQFNLAGAKEGDISGVIPDIYIPADKAMDYTLELIKKDRKKLH